MTQRVINIGIVANDNSADPIRSAFTKVNDNFSELYNHVLNLKADNINGNIAIGVDAGSSIITGSNNTIIGSLLGSSDLEDTVLIGAGSTERIKVDATGLYVNGTLFNGSNRSVPATSKGASGDKLGMLAFDNTYIYYCKADYTDGVADIWNRTAQTVNTW